MNRRVAMIVTLVLIAAALAGVIGTTAYRAGMTRGLAETGHVPAPWVYHGLFWHPGAFLFPLLGLFLVLALVRGFFWRGWCGRDLWRTGGPPAFEEWHRRAHQSPPPDDSAH